MGGRTNSSGFSGNQQVATLGNDDAWDEIAGEKNIPYALFTEESKREADALYENSEWRATLTEDEEDAIMRYSGDECEIINDELRKGKADYKGWETSKKEVQEVIKTLKGAMERYELAEPTIFHRTSGTEILRGVNTVAGIREMAKRGEIVTDKGFTSTSAVLGSNWTPRDSSEIYYHIKTPANKGAGLYIGNMCMYWNQHEYTFAPGSSYKILGAYEDDDGYIHCNMEYVGRLEQT